MPVQPSEADFAILWTENTYDTAGKIMGRQSAGAGLLRAIAARQPERLVCATPTQSDAESCARALAKAGASKCAIEWSPLWGDGAALRQVGALYRPDPNIVREAWRRSPRGASAYSLIGVTHTLCTTSAQRAVSDILTAPVEPWDALICTSQAARAAVYNIMEATREHLRGRFQVARFVEPQLPVLPLGVHPDDFVIAPGERANARTAMSISEDEIVVLYAGRLTPVKANAVPMLLALQEAAKGRPITLVQAGVFPDPRLAEYYRAEAFRVAPSVRHIFVDGMDAARYRAAWACADIFTSLVDSFQETFGITPLEAMASGLPVVVSDWDGYKDTVRNGVDGFRIPTLALPPERLKVFTNQYADSYIDLDRVLLQTASYVAVDIGKASVAFSTLFSSSDMRRKMGGAGQARVRADFDWRVIAERYYALAHELARLRPQPDATAIGLGDPVSASFFSTFSQHPSQVVGPRLQLRRSGGRNLDLPAALRLFSAQASGAAPPEALLSALLQACSDGSWTPLSLAAGRVRPASTEAAEAAAVWLVKFGLLEAR